MDKFPKEMPFISEKKSAKRYVVMFTLP